MKILKTLMVAMLLLTQLSYNYGQCGTYTTTSAGDYFTASNWVDGLQPPNPIPVGVTVDLDHDMTCSGVIENNGTINATGNTLTLLSGGQYGGSESLTGDIVNNGTISPGTFASGTIVTTTAGLTTVDVTNILATTATSGGDICHDGGSAVTDRGVCWSTSMNPTTADNTTSDGSGTGTYTSSLTGLTAGTTYYVRAYATNGVGTSYGTEKSFTTTSAVSYPAGTVHCLSGGADIVEVTNPSTGKVWMDRNLGASQAATSSADANAYGDLYQWGRFSDGHQCRNSGTTSTNATTAVPNAGNSWYGLFITESGSPYDWLTPQDGSLWQGVNGTNNPCPSGYRLPTKAEWDAEHLSWSSNNAAGAFASPLKLPLAGYRRYSNGSLDKMGSVGFYWSSTVGGIYSRYLYFYSVNADVGSYLRAYGFSVRCLKDD